MTFRVTGRVRVPVGVKRERVATIVGPSRELCAKCEFMTRDRCFHPFNGKPCNPARNSPWTHPKPCPVTLHRPTPALPSPA